MESAGARIGPEFASLSPKVNGKGLDGTHFFFSHLRQRQSTRETSTIMATQSTCKCSFPIYMRGNGRPETVGPI